MFLIRPNPVNFPHLTINKKKKRRGYDRPFDWEPRVRGRAYGPLVFVRKQNSEFRIREARHSIIIQATQNIQGSLTKNVLHPIKEGPIVISTTRRPLRPSSLRPLRSISIPPASKRHKFKSKKNKSGKNEVGQREGAGHVMGALSISRAGTTTF